MLARYCSMTSAASDVPFADGFVRASELQHELLKAVVDL